MRRIEQADGNDSKVAGEILQHMTLTKTSLAGGNDEKQRYFQATIEKAKRRGGEVTRLRNTPLSCLLSLIHPQHYSTEF